jgi:hypothetical protein
MDYNKLFAYAEDTDDIPPVNNYSNSVDAITLVASRCRVCIPAGSHGVDVPFRRPYRQLGVLSTEEGPKCKPTHGTLIQNEINTLMRMPLPSLSRRNHLFTHVPQLGVYIQHL